MTISCFLLSSCSKEKKTPCNLSYREVTQAALQAPLFDAQIIQAKHFDIPVPTGFELHATSSSYSSSCFPTTKLEEDSVAEIDISTTFLQYSGKQKLKQLKTFYLREMELAGWDISDFSSTQEGLFACQKPTKQCVISLRQEHNDTPSSIYVFIKGRGDLTA
ncbi:MAG: hypothetical protein H6679_02710 [Epsilonproteobacteria bacterium]|nr:hypothetical protein [Campylobacterota bacterium]